jgi:ABC-type amino acid transport system permease subunit
LWGLLDFFMAGFLNSLRTGAAAIHIGRWQAAALTGMTLVQATDRIEAHSVNAFNRLCGL